MQGELIDDFADAGLWSAVASGQAELRLYSDPVNDGHALRLDFDFKGGGGFVVARKALNIAIPESFAFTFKIRGRAPINKFEFKLADPSGRNVWWFHRDQFPWPEDWVEIRIPSSQIEFAWGPTWGANLTEIGAIELVIAAGEGGEGAVWISDFRFEDDSKRPLPAVAASDFLPGHEPANVVSSEGDWRSSPGVASVWLSLDFDTPREYGGLVIEWVEGLEPRAFTITRSDDRQIWEPAYRAPQAGARRNYVFMHDGHAQHLRLQMEAGPQGLGIERITVRPFEFSRSLSTFFQQVARIEPKGHYPRYWRGEQSYWSPVGVLEGPAQGLLNEEGMAEIAPGSCSIEPFLWVDGALQTWADGTTELNLERDYLPIPSVKRTVAGLHLTVTLFADKVEGVPCLFLRYRLLNHSDRALSARLYTAIRPFQVTPPWQSFNRLGGTSDVSEIRYDGNTVTVNGGLRIVSLQPANGFGAAAFSQGDITEFLAAGRLPNDQRIQDVFGHGSGALQFDVSLATGADEDIYLMTPYFADAPTFSGRIDGSTHFAAACDAWSHCLTGLEVGLPAEAQALFDTYRTAIAHVLIHRDGPALQPGPRRYTRSWIRDGAIMATALLRHGCAEQAKDFIRWYASFQREDGFVPCCVDTTGPDWLPEYDSQGEFLFAIMECYRLTHDLDLLRDLWPAAERALAYFERLRAQRLTDTYRQPEHLACYGLLPESASHEGYLAHPVHAFWDNFWALRGIKDIQAMAETLQFPAEAARIDALRAAYAKDVYASLDYVAQTRKLKYVPGSVEWADCDPSATAVAIAPLDELAAMPRDLTESTFDIYLQRFRDCRSGKVDWPNYTAYEIRIIPALIRLGRRDEAWELLQFFIGDRRPLAWNQWPEISWRDPRSPGHIGDVPHTWISAEYVLSFMNIFAFERDADQALVIAAGIPNDWLNGDGVSVVGLRTRYGVLDFTVRRESAELVRIQLGDRWAVPPGGLVAALPLTGAIVAVEADSSPIENGAADHVRVLKPVRELVIRHR